MIVDDQTDILEQVKSYLDEDDYNVITMKNRREALELLEQESTIDLMLINMSISTNNKESFFSMKPNIKPNLEENDNYLSKPFTKTQLLNFINRKI